VNGARESGWFEMNFMSMPTPDHIDVVVSTIPGYYYPCPTLEAVDQHLRDLLAMLGPSSNLTDTRKRAVRIDVDRLLERRSYLMLVNAA
jgi:hypothetical protein